MLTSNNNRIYTNRGWKRPLTKEKGGFTEMKKYIVYKSYGFSAVKMLFFFQVEKLRRNGFTVESLEY